jgi:molybdopterin/thiamine biosynthesis adenylyltransferase
MTPTQIQRYARHLVLKEIGGPGQNKLLAARIVIVGAGGLGGPAALYAAAAGIGHITIIDDDVVEVSNLQRQVQFIHSDVGMPKANIMVDTLADLNPDLTLEASPARLTAENAQSLLSGHDLILDGTDSFAARFAVNQASYDLGIPLLSGALGRFNGQIGLFNTGENAPCYQCFVPDIPPDEESCAAVGVIGALAGIIGSMMTLEAIKYITGAGESLAGSLYLYEGLSGKSRKINLPKDPACQICG